MIRMDDMNAKLAESLPYFDPFMGINVSCICATTKLIQCAMFGPGMCDVSQKFFKKKPEEVKDLSRDDFLARKALIELVNKFDKEHGSKDGPWIPILYAYELARGSSKRHEDFAHMIFTNSEVTRFLMVNMYGPPTCKCGNPYHSDYRVLTKMHAHRFMSLLKYLYHDKEDPQPEWLRATYTTTIQPLRSDFLVPTNATTLPTPKNLGDQPDLYNVTATSFTPSLNEHILQRIDSLLSRSKSMKIAPLSVREAVTGKGTGKPDIKNIKYMDGKVAVQRECANCHKLDKAMQTCAQCKTVFYCNAKCQKEHWRLHKVFCHAPPTPTPNATKSTDEAASGSEAPEKHKAKRVKKSKKGKADETLIEGMANANLKED